MSSTIAHRIILTAHDSTPSEAIKSLEATVTVTESAVLTLRYSLHADMSRIRVASKDSEQKSRLLLAGRTDGLWKHTCFEVFIQPAGSTGYYELNFSPAEQWAAYRFDSYREGMTTVQLSNPPDISVRGSPHHLDLDATVALPVSATTGAARGSKLALTAVVEEENGRLCYWSARHPPGKPDFHHSHGFVFELPQFAP